MQPTKLPLIVVPTNRDATLDTDSKLVNGFIEKAADEQMWVCKRPGFDEYAQVGFNGDSGLGVYNWRGAVISIWGASETTTGAYLRIRWVNVNPIVSETYDGLDNSFGSAYSFTTISPTSASQNESESRLFFHNGVSAYVFQKIDPSDRAYFSADMVTGSNVLSNVTIDTNNLQLGMFLYSAGAPLGSFITEIVDATTVKISQNATYTGTVDYNYWNGLQQVQGTYSVNTFGDLTSGSANILNMATDTGNIPVTSLVTGSGIPANTEVVSILGHDSLTMSATATASATGATINFFKYNWRRSVPGVATVDGTTYAMTSAAFVNGSDIGDPLSWGGDNYIAAHIDPDAAVYLTRQSAFIVAMKEYSTEIFYDAGNPAPGSPLSPVQGAAFTIGCKHSASVVSIEGNLFWIGQNKAGGIGVYQMSGLKPHMISTPSIEKILQAADYAGKIYSFAIQFNGHKFYVVTLVASNVTLIYDMTTNVWAQWTDTYGNYVPFVASTFTDGNQAYLQHMNNGALYEINPNATSDWNGNITLDLITPNFDAGTRFRKYLKCIDFIGDQVQGSTMFVRSSNDDYQTWNEWRVLDLSKTRPFFMNCGTFRRRAYWFRHDGDCPMRLQSVELQLDIGTL